MAGERPPPREPDEFDPGSQRSGWQHEAVSRVERSFRDAVLFPQFSEQARALVDLLQGDFGQQYVVLLESDPQCPLQGFWAAVLTETLKSS